jgi:hypothetical protein
MHANAASWSPEGILSPLEYAFPPQSVGSRANVAEDARWDQHHDPFFVFVFFQPYASKIFFKH